MVWKRAAEVTWEVGVPAAPGGQRAGPRVGIFRDVTPIARTEAMRRAASLPTSRTSCARRSRQIAAAAETLLEASPDREDAAQLTALDRPAGRTDARS